MTTTTAAAGLSSRHVAMLRAVAAGRAELTCSRVPDLYVDGRCCTDHSASALLVTAGLVAAGPEPRTATGRVPARVTAVGRALLVDPAHVADPRPATDGAVIHDG